MRKRSTLLLIAASLVGSPALAENAAAPAGAAALTEWSLDASHSRVAFSVPHMVVSEVEGQFKTWRGKVLLDEKDFKNSQLEFSAEVASIDTGDAERDKHLRGPDFFDADKFRELTFKATSISKAGKGYKLQGQITIHGVTKPVTLDATLSEAVQSPWGKQVRAAHITGKIKRQDFGLNWNKTLDKGGVVVGDTVTIEVKVELNK